MTSCCCTRAWFSPTGDVWTCGTNAAGWCKLKFEPLIIITWSAWRTCVGPLTRAVYKHIPSWWNCVRSRTSGTAEEKQDQHTAAANFRRSLSPDRHFTMKTLHLSQITMMTQKKKKSLDVTEAASDLFFFIVTFIWVSQIIEKKIGWASNRMKKLH